MLTTLPLVIFSLVAAVGTTYHFSYNALTDLAESLLESKLSEAVRATREQEDILYKYGLDNVPASVEKAQIDAGSAMLWIKIGDEGYIFAVDDGGLITAHPDRSLVGRDVSGEDWFHKMVNSHEGGVDLTFRGVRYLAKYDHFDPWGWYILAVDSEREVYGAVNRMRPYVLSLGIVTLFIVALVLMLVTRRLLAPLKSLTTGAEQIGKGNLKTRIAVRTDDEIGRLARVFNSMTTQLEETLTALRYKEQYFRSLIENATDIIAILDGDGNIIYGSPSNEKILGYPSEVVINKKFSEFVHPAELSDFMKFFEEMCRIPGIIESTEIRFRHTDGSWRTLEVVGNNLLDDQAVSGIVLNCRDVSQRKSAEEALRESEKKYRNLIEQANDGIIILQDARVKYVNQRLADLLGYTREDMMDTPHIRYVHPELVSESIERNRRRTAGEAVETIHENVLRQKGGADIYVEVNAEAILFEGKVSNLVFVRDITARKRAEESLRESQERYRAIFEQAADSIVLIDAETGDLMEFNDMAHESLGFTREEFEKLRIPDFEVVESVEEVARHIKKIVNEGTDQFETKHKTKGGEIRTIHVSSKAIYVRGKDFIQSIWHDITERKEFEAVLKKSQQELRRLANKLITAQEVERLRLARELHDDISQRLAVLSIEAGKIEQLLKATPERFLDKFRWMQDELVNLSSDIHAISLRLHPSILEDLGLSDAIKSESDAIIKREGIVINYEPGSVPPDLSKDVALCFYRIFQEGLSNVAKHARATEVNIYLSCHKNQIQLSIEDNGQGFDLNKMDKKPGLGLASMEERIRFIGGNFNIRSKSGEGTYIAVKAPLEAKPGQAGNGLMIDD